MNTYPHLHRLFSEHLNKYTGSLKNLEPGELYQPEAYILSLGGKRVRPLLALVGCELCNGDPARALDAALSVELFHNFSLIHDDILDEAPLRRQEPTVHHRFGSNVAILAGDVMLVKALRALAAYEPVLHKQLTGHLHTTAIEVCEGQQMDMNFENAAHVTVEEYIRMITLKTAVLLGCSLRMGALCAGANEKTCDSLYEFGKHIGIAFQLLDDLLDCFPGDAFGKQVGGDICANKKTFLLLKALELAGEKDRNELSRLMENEHDPAVKIKGVTVMFSRLGVDKLCRESADEHTEKAVKLLSALPCDPQKKDRLAGFANALLNRNV